MIELLLFSGKNCGVCSILEPKLREVSENYSKLKFTVIKVEENPEIAAQHMVFSLPVLLVFAENKETYRFKGSFSIREIEAKLQRLIQLMHD